MMQVIIISPKSKTNRHIHLSKRVMFSSLLLVMAAALLLVNWGKQSAANPHQPLQDHIAQQKFDTFHPPVDNNTTQTANNDFLAKRLGELQAEAIRIKAITDQLADMSGLDLTAFQTPVLVVGGLDNSGESLSQQEMEDDIAKLKEGFSQQREQLSELQKYLLTQSSITSSIPSGKPAQSGWVSSFYGKRIDPFTGKKAFHRGVDVAGKSGTGVIAVADGMVTWIGERGGYGGLVEIDHGNGYVTRYAHNKTIKVELGELVAKGQVIALMGSTGRSTGPHVHFEVLHDGKNVNPYNFIKK